MQKNDKNHIRFGREWNPKRIAMIHMVQALRDLLRNPESIEGMTSDNYLKILVDLPRGDQRDALAWFADEWSEEVFSFNWACEILEISPAKNRERVLNLEVTFEMVEYTQIAFID